MANVTLSITVDNLSNPELDSVEQKFWKFLNNNPQVPIGKVTDVSELEREEDDEDEDENNGSD